MDLVLLFFISLSRTQHSISIFRHFCCTVFGAAVEERKKKLKCLAAKWAEIRKTFPPLIKNPFFLLQMGLMASYALWAASRSFSVFLLSRIIGGISKGNVSLSTAVIADLHSPKARSKGMVSYTCGADVWVYWLTFNRFQVLQIFSSAACSLIKWKHDLLHCLAFENVPDGFAGELSHFPCQWLSPPSEMQMS